ncbi:MAG: ROK family transcriptional regulator [Nakamurella sp.]
MFSTLITQTAPGSVGSLFQHVRFDGPCTRADLVATTGLARSTVNARLDALLANGLVSAAGEGVSTGGRPPTRFVVNPRARVVLAMDIGATHATVGVTDLSGAILGTQTEELDVSAGPEPVLDRAIAMGQALLTDCGVSEIRVAGVGIGLPGPVEHATGKATNPPIMPGWNAFDVPAYVQRTVDAPVLVDNDVNVMAIGEHATGWATVQHMLFVKIATGIGAGIISDGRINRGSQGTAGDLGHVQVPGARGRPCRCGNIGCLEAIASGPAIVQQLSEAGMAISTPRQLLDRVRAGDLRAIDAVRQAGREIGAVLASCVSLLNPSAIVVGGFMVGAGPQLIAGIREIVYQRALPIAANNLTIATSAAGRFAGVRGAAFMVIDSALSADSVNELIV